MQQARVQELGNRVVADALGPQPCISIRQRGAGIGGHASPVLRQIGEEGEKHEAANESQSVVERECFQAARRSCCSARPRCRSTDAERMVSMRSNRTSPSCTRMASPSSLPRYLMSGFCSTVRISIGAFTRGLLLSEAVPAGPGPSLVRVRDQRPVGDRSAGRGGKGAHAFDQRCFHSLDDCVSEEVPRCCGFTLVEQHKAVEPRMATSNHLLESLDKIRLPRDPKHGSAVHRRILWLSRFMDAHRHNPPIGVKQSWLRKCG